MPQTKPDQRFASHVGMMLGGLAIAALVGIVLCTLAAQRGSTGLWIAVGVLIGCVALSGLAYSAWIFRCYRCPQCHCRLRPEPGARLRYHCDRCDTIWDSGITWGGE